MTSRRQLKVYFVLGEDSGDALGAKILDAFEALDTEVSPHGLAGKAMESRGAASLFDISDLSVMGISAVVSRLPTLLKRIKQTTQDILAKSPDVLLLIDSPDFSYRVAKKVRAANPGIKIVKFVAPSVWAWRPGRARKISPYIDHILAILPFEPQLLSDLGGPETTYVGHPLSAAMPAISAADRKHPSDPVKLVILPGSRMSEVKPLLPVLKDTVERLGSRANHTYEITLPAVDRLADVVRTAVADWSVQPNIVIGEEGKQAAFEEADVAICASGTVTLELAVYKVPMVSVYKLDWMMMPLRHLITVWTAALPNLIADYPVIPERINEFAHPDYIARLIERLSVDSPERQAQLDGFEVVADRMQQEVPAQELAVRKILELAGK